MPLTLDAMICLTDVSVSAEYGTLTTIEDGTWDVPHLPPTVISNADLMSVCLYWSLRWPTQVMCDSRALGISREVKRWSGCGIMSISPQRRRHAASSLLKPRSAGECL